MIAKQGSNRIYTRERDVNGKSIIRVQGTNRDENRAFIYLARHFRSKGLPVPEVLWVAEDEMSYTQTDLGDTLLFDNLDRSLLVRTLRALAHIQVIGAEGLDWSFCYPVPEMDERAIRWDLNYFKYCFLKGTKIEFSEPKLGDDFDRLVRNLLSSFTSHLSTFLYRDCQSRNVMIVDGDPYFIDFQGGRKGPTQYDIASFLWQAKANFSPDLRAELIEEYLDELNKISNFQFPISNWKAALPNWVLLRLLQVLGAYGYRGYFERKPHFLESIPNALRNLSDLFASNPELQTQYPYLYALSHDLLVLV